MKKTFSELKEIDEVVGALYTKNPKLGDGKFGYAYNKFYEKNVKPINEEIQDKMMDFKIDNAMTDPVTKELLYEKADERGNKAYKYTKEGMKNLIKDQRKFLKEIQAKSVEIKPYITKDVPEMTEEQKEALKGCVI